MTVAIALCSFFMELGFLEPTGFVYLGGLAAFYCTLQGIRKNRGSWFVVAGLAVALAIHYKTVGLFYGLGIIAFLGFDGIRRRVWGLMLCVWFPCLTAGMVVGLAIPAAFFWSQGRLNAFWLWTFYYPATMAGRKNNLYNFWDRGLME